MTMNDHHTPKYPGTVASVPKQAVMAHEELHQSLMSWNLGGSKRRSMTQPPGHVHPYNASTASECLDGDVFMKPVKFSPFPQELENCRIESHPTDTTTTSSDPELRGRRGPNRSSSVQRSVSVVNFPALPKKSLNLNNITSVPTEAETASRCLKPSSLVRINDTPSRALQLNCRSFSKVQASVVEPDHVNGGATYGYNKYSEGQWFHWLRVIDILSRVLNNYLYVLLNFCIILSLVFGISRFAFSLHRDLNKRIAFQRRELFVKAKMCEENYIQNRCDPELRVPALSNLCSEWETCMNTFDIASYKEAATTAEILGNVIHSFFDQFSLLTRLIQETHSASNFVMPLEENNHSAVCPASAHWSQWGIFTSCSMQVTEKRSFSKRICNFLESRFEALSLWMSVSRPIVGVYNALSPKKPEDTILMPKVMEAPIRYDLVSFVYTNIARNHRQAYGVKEGAGYQSSAESWGTGRAVARIPRVAGGGTHCAGQAAFGNMCRGGGMFAPNKVWRRWHRSVNLTQRRHAVTSAIAASSFTGLVMAHGHRINNIPELPLVVSDDLQDYRRTCDAVAFLKRIGCEEELERVNASKKIRAGKGKSRNRRYTLRKGPLIIYENDNGIVHAFANVPGVESCHVDRLNLLQLAPGGVVGRFIIWTRSAFAKLNEFYEAQSPLAKHSYSIHRPIMTNPDLARIINSNEVQSQLNLPKKKALPAKRNKNALKNKMVRCRLDPAYKILKLRRQRANQPGTALNQKVREKQIQKKLAKKEYRKQLAPFISQLRELDNIKA